MPNPLTTEDEHMRWETSMMMTKGTREAESDRYEGSQLKKV
jgi:hypothetical protein